MSEMTREEALAHFGVKGMKWGVRRESSPQSTTQMQRRVNKINKKLDGKGGQKAFDGAELVGYGLNKQYQKNLKKDPFFKYGQLNAEQKAAYQKAGVSATYRKLAVATTVDLIAFGAGGQLLVKTMAPSGPARLGGQIAMGLLAGQVGKSHFNEARSIRYYVKSEKLRNERNALEKKIAKAPKP